MLNFHTIKKVIREPNSFQTAPLLPVKRTKKKVVEFIILTIAGTLIGVSLFGHAKTSIGPLQTIVSLQPTIAGGTVIELGPLGEISFASHKGLIRVKIEVKSLTPDLATELVGSTDKLGELTNSVSNDFRRGFIEAAVKSSLAATGFSFILVFIAFRRFKLSLAASLL